MACRALLLPAMQFCHSQNNSKANNTNNINNTPCPHNWGGSPAFSGFRIKARVLVQTVLICPSQQMVLWLEIFTTSQRNHCAFDASLCQGPGAMEHITLKVCLTRPWLLQKWSSHRESQNVPYKVINYISNSHYDLSERFIPPGATPCYCQLISVGIH